jgi:hypothetical protein
VYARSKLKVGDVTGAKVDSGICKPTTLMAAKIATVTDLAQLVVIGIVTRRQASVIAKPMLWAGPVTHAKMDSMAWMLVMM